MPTPGARLSGRDEELRGIQLMLADPQRGESGAALLRGEAGIGKTASLEPVAARARGTGPIKLQAVVRGPRA
ncbi:ATP-binding protein [Streptomyces sp. NPDC004296]|uniref:ATP-binding protein n=1 Tax=Streptomyces sp. NPDC004296 TaxID=3364697 RepID=UPI0036A997BA